MGQPSLIHLVKAGTARRPAVISLGNHPGARAFTRTPRSAQLHARFRVSPITAALEVWYALGKSLQAPSPAVELTLMMEPPVPSPSIRAATSRQQVQRPRTFT